MPGCNFVAEGKDVAEVMAKGEEHAKKAHGISQIPARPREEGPGGDQGQVTGPRAAGFSPRLLRRIGLA
ncbi:MAG: hypothetical protein DMD98_00185 [Candidatus Rokuibacteriota bacterium]|nr:MAG: hypothetical protein DMD98_00185 [Candidatus Rokubacteria bacterium]